MSNWASSNPEEAERIAALPPSQQNQAERAAVAPAVEYAERKRALEEALGDHDTHLSLPALRNRLAWQREAEETWR